MSSLLKRARSWLGQLHRPRWDWLTFCAILVVAIQFAMTWSGGVELMLASWAISCHSEVIAKGGVWTFFTYAFVHAGWLHLVFNLLGLWLFGGRLIRYMGERKALLTFLLGVFIGGIFHVVVGLRLLQGGYREPWLVGMSGGVVALWLCLTVLAPGAKMWPLPVRGRALRYGLLISLIWLVMSQPQLELLSVFTAVGGVDAYDAEEGGQVISHACHLGGALAGIWMGKRFLGKKITKLDLQRERAKREG